MKNLKRNVLASAVALSSVVAVPTLAATTVAEALSGGKAYGDFNLRYEAVDQDNALDDASALTLRSRIGYVTDSLNGFSATVEFEDSRIVAGVDEFSVPPTGFQTGEYSFIADPETTELDQAFIQYKTDMVTAKLGRQVLTLDNHRFVGHVGWRQDRQTFDGLSLVATPVAGLTVTYAYLDERNRIFAEAADVDSKDHLLNLSYKTPVGTLTAYSYLLEMDVATDNALDTYGVRFAGSTEADGTKFLYELEYATQSSEMGSSDFDADYLLLEGGVVISGITAKLGYEVLGSDDGDYGFSTPLATLHKFNGWADMFLATPGVGIEDMYVSVGTKVGPGMLTVVYHDFSADDASASLDELGSEVDVSYGMKFGKHYNAGIKYAAYSADDFSVDTDKLWVWVGASF
ncbi:alginate export family protein [Pseudomaricurvus alcaniphilus]|uniref:alginate export family protein n=1 Tax=Pseudomaricurvus alcaniphilus TaxID=1166482 RepID=UPI0014086037|nr:alginate export family protein [Pseudomaricurvus alcaniphilus]NHN37987.1 alginate export family protein [Pseudomaricurvus alcaniphilus]